jgi:hypothetical protein
MHLMRTLLIPALVGSLIVQSLPAQQPAGDGGIQQRIAGLPAKAHVTIHLVAGNTVRGRIDSTGNNNFVLHSDDGGGRQTIAYTEVSSVDQIKGHTTRKWVIIGVVAGVAVLGIIAAVIVHNHTVLNGPVL